MAEKSARLVSLDAFRGLTIAAMILVNNPGSWDHVYWPLRHAAWHGWTPTDLIFPFFLFIVGVAIPLALGRRREGGLGAAGLYAKILTRTLIIFAIGLALNFVPKFDPGTLRLPGVLQRIAVCYLVASVLYLKSAWKGRAVWAFLLMAVYWAAMKLVPVPGYGAGDLSLAGNLAGYVDRSLLGGHLYLEGFDPEGFLSTLPAVATALLGVLCGDWLKSRWSLFTKWAGIWVAGTLLGAAGILLHPVVPINKQLWTPSFVLFTAGAALLLFGACYLVIDGIKLRFWAFPFLVFGTNAIVTYAGASLMAKIIQTVSVRSAAGPVTLKAWVYAHAFAPWAGPLNGSLAFAIVFVLVWFGAALPLYLKKIFIKI
jgi:predicted acyltransferase